MERFDQEGGGDMKYIIMGLIYYFIGCCGVFYWWTRDYKFSADGFCAWFLED